MPAGVNGFDHLYRSKPTALNERSIFSYLIAPYLTRQISLMLGWKSIALRVATAPRNPFMPAFLRFSMGLIMYPGRGSSSSEMTKSNSPCSPSSGTGAVLPAHYESERRQRVRIRFLGAGRWNSCRYTRAIRNFMGGMIPAARL